MTIAGYVCPKGIKADGVQYFLKGILAKGRSARTHNYYLQAVKQFNTWIEN